MKYFWPVLLASAIVLVLTFALLDSAAWILVAIPAYAN